MDQIDLLELRVGQESFGVLTIVIHITCNISFHRATSNLLDKTLAEILEEQIERLIKLKAFLNWDLLHYGFILSEEVWILFEFLEFVLRKECSLLLHFLLFNLIQANRLVFIPSWIPTSVDYIVNSLWSGRALASYIPIIFLDWMHATLSLILSSCILCLLLLNDSVLRSNDWLGSKAFVNVIMSDAS